MARVIRYEADKVNDFKPHDDGTGSFSSFVISAQMRKPLVRAAYDIIAIAKASEPPSGDPRDGHYSDKFSVTAQRMMMFKPKSGPRQFRAVARIINDAKNAAALEFGSGDESIGTPGVKRPQGGWNHQRRPLGRAAGKIGDWHE